MTRAVVAIMAIVFVGVIGVAGLEAAANNAGDTNSIDAESFTPDAGNVTELDHSNLNHTHYADSVKVYDDNGNLMDRNADYRWIDDNGTIYTVEGGDLDGAPSATIDYQYSVTTSDQRALIGIVAQLPNVLGVLVPFLGVALVLLFLKG